MGKERQDDDNSPIYARVQAAAMYLQIGDSDKTTDSSCASSDQSNLSPFALKRQDKDQGPGYTACNYIGGL